MAEPTNTPAEQPPAAPTLDASETDPVTKATGQQDVNPWSVSGEVGEDGRLKAIDYKKLTDEFGTTPIDDALLERWERATGTKPHRFMRRQIVISHRDLGAILDRYEKVFVSCPPVGIHFGTLLTCVLTERTLLLIHWSWTE
jgi:hypothetical protein